MASWVSSHADRFGADTLDRILADDKGWMEVPDRSFALPLLSLRGPCYHQGLWTSCSCLILSLKSAVDGPVELSSPRFVYKNARHDRIVQRQSVGRSSESTSILHQQRTHLARSDKRKQPTLIVLPERMAAELDQSSESRLDLTRERPLMWEDD